MPSIGYGLGFRLDTQLSPSEQGPPSLANLQQWLDASSLGLTNGASVTTMPDKSGHGNVVSQTTGILQPPYATGQINGLGAVKFRNVPQRLSGLLVFTHPYTFCSIVVLQGNDASYNTLYSNDVGSFGFFTHNKNIAFVSTSTTQGAITLNDGTPYCLIWQSIDSTHIQPYVNGVADSILTTTISTGTVNDIGSDTVGDNGSFDFGESLMYNATVNIPSLYAYTKRWGT